MTAKTVIIKRRAIALQRIETFLPKKIIDTLPALPEPRLMVVLEYIADLFEKQAVARAAKNTVEVKEVTDGSGTV